MAYGLAGRRAQAREVLAQLEQRAASQDVRPVNFAWVHLGLGENHAALDWLETAYTKHHANILFLRCVSFYDPLRSEPRYQQLLARLPLLPRAGE
jgi:hypothetical protein